MNTQKPHTIIGNGIIGLMTAYHLTNRGVPVTLIDEVNPGDRAQASYGNAGVIALGSVMPLGEPGLWLQGLKMMLDPQSSLTIPWSYRLKIIPWLVKVLKESSVTRWDQNARATAELNQLSGIEWRQMITRLRLQSIIKETGWLKVFETDRSMQAMDAGKAYMEEYGFQYQQLNSDEVRQIEPELAPIFRHGLLQSDSLSITQPDQLLKELKTYLEARGVRFLQQKITAIQRHSDGFLLQGPGESIACQQLSVCAGAWSQRLLSSLGCQYPLETERGYHMLFDSVPGLNRPVIHMERYMVLCPMTSGLRMTSGVELAGLDAKANYQPIRAKIVDAKRMLPKLNTVERDQWLGFRPSMPDSKPVISAHPDIDGLFMAFGHGHLGITQGAATGKLLAQLICGEATDIDPLPFDASRF